MARHVDIAKLYDLFEALHQKNGKTFHLLEKCNGRMGWPERGVYFFFEESNISQNEIDGLKVCRIGTHALKTGARSTLWKRLAQHKGSARSGGGNHRGSIFRLLVGEALQIRESKQAVPSWGLKNDPGAAARALGIDRQDLKQIELPHEQAVSQFIGKLPFLVLDIPDEPGPASLRGHIERNSIALLSNFNNSRTYSHTNRLGAFSKRQRVRESGLWNNNHVDETYDPDFLSAFEGLTDKMEPLS